MARAATARAIFRVRASFRTTCLHVCREMRMKRTLTDWRRALGAGCVALAVASVPSVTFAQAQDAGATNAQQVDPARKQLIAANGLFARGLFKLAAQEYADFLDKYPTHADATTARYAL